MLGPAVYWSLGPKIARTREVRCLHVLKSMKTQNRVCKLIIQLLFSEHLSDKDPVPPAVFLLGTVSILHAHRYCWFASGYSVIQFLKGGGIKRKHFM